MYVIKNLKTDQYYQRINQRNFYHASLKQATRIKNEQTAFDIASNLSSEVSQLGLIINFKVIEIGD